MQGPGSFGVVAYIAVITGAPGQGLFVYNGVPATGNLIASIAVFKTTDGHGNVVEAGIVDYVSGTSTGSLFVQLEAGRVNFGSHDTTSILQNDGSIGGSDSTVSNPSQPSTFIFSPNSNPTGGQTNNICQIVMLGSNPAGLKPRVMLFAGVTGNGIPVASVADVEVRGTLAVTPIGSGTIALTVQEATDTNPRFTVDDNGVVSWGPGNAATDTTFFRQGAGNLQTNGSLTAQASVNAFQSVGIFKANDTNLAFQITTLFDANNRFQIDDQGTMSWGAGGSSPVDVTFGRPATAGFLRITGGLQVTNLIELFSQNAGAVIFEAVVNTEANARFLLINTGEMEWGNGGSSAPDTTLIHTGTGQMSLSAASANGTYLFSVTQTANSTGGISVTMNQAGDFAHANYVTGDATAAPRVVTTGDSDIRFGPGGSTAPDAIIARTGVALLNVTSNLSVNNGKAGNVFAVGVGPSDFAGTVYLEDAAAPATPGTASALYSKSGNLHYVSEDGNDYGTGVQHVAINPVQTIAVTTPANITNASFAVAARSYKWHARIWYSTSAAAGAPEFNFTVPANTGAASTNATYTTTVTAGNAQARANVTVGAGAIGTGLPLSAGSGGVLDIWCHATFTAAGTIQLTAFTSATTDPFVVETVDMELYPL